MLSKISMLMLGVTDLSRSVVFYRDTLGLACSRELGEFAFFSAGAITLVLSVPLGRAASPVAGAVEVIFPVDGVDAACALLTKRGLPAEHGPHEVIPGSWAANFRDPDGHLLTVYGPR